MTALVLCAILTFSLAAAPPEEKPAFSSQATMLEERRAVAVTLREGEAVRLAHAASTDPAARLVEYRRAKRCGVASQFPATVLSGPCPPAAGIAGLSACRGDVRVLPLWTRSRPVGEPPVWSGWSMVDSGGCAVDMLPVLTAEDFRVLPLAAPVLVLQPDQGWVLVGKETIVMTDPAEQVLRTQLLGYGVDVVASPVSFSYDFGDGSVPLVTRSPGRAWPDQDTFHVYGQVGTRQITLTTTWSGRYRVDGSPRWREVTGTAQTTATSAPFEVQERRSRLVDGTCDTHPAPDDC